MALGKMIKKLRLAKGWDQPTLSERSGVEIGTTSALEVRDSVRSKYAHKIAAALGVSVSALYGEEVPGTAPEVQPRQDVNDSGLSPLALDLARRWMNLSPDRQEWFRDLIFTMAFVEQRFPAMRKGRPRGEHYTALERAIERDMRQLKLNLEP